MENKKVIKQQNITKVEDNVPTSDMNKENNKIKKEPEDYKTLYYHPTTHQPYYGSPIYFDAKTGKNKKAEPVEIDDILQKEPDRKGKLTFAIAGIITVIVGMAVFGLCYLLVSLTTGISNGTDANGMFWGLVVLTWLFGPIMMVSVPPVCYLIGLILSVIGCCFSPKRVIPWLFLVLNIGLVILGIFIFIWGVPGAF